VLRLRMRRSGPFEVPARQPMRMMAVRRFLWRSRHAADPYTGCTAAPDRCGAGRPAPGRCPSRGAQAADGGGSSGGGGGGGGGDRLS
jgi:hypothetical protein